MNQIPLVPRPGSASQSMFPDLDAAYQRQLKTLARVRRAVATVATSRKRLELQLSELERETGNTERGTSAEIEEVRRHLDVARDEERRVGEASQRLQNKISALHSAQLAVQDAYTAAEETAKQTLVQVVGHT